MFSLAGCNFLYFWLENTGSIYHDLLDFCQLFSLARAVRAWARMHCLIWLCNHLKLRHVQALRARFLQRPIKETPGLKQSIYLDVYG